MLPEWLQQLVGPYWEALRPLIQHIAPLFQQIMKTLVAALDALARPLAPVLHQIADAASPRLLVRPATAVASFADLAVWQSL